MSTAVAEVAPVPSVAQSLAVSFVLDGDHIAIPAWVKDLASFCCWEDSDDFPDRGRICYLKGVIWVDVSMEQLFTHLRVKAQFFAVLEVAVQEGNLGWFFPDGVSLRNPGANIGVKPDAVFVASQTLEAGRVRFVEGKEAGYVALEGSPDMVLEIVSAGSEQKDYVTLRQAYWDAGVLEYWLVDARTNPPTFDILRHTRKGYRATPKTESWVKSGVFGKSFLLTQRTTKLGHPEYTLAVR